MIEWREGYGRSGPDIVSAVWAPGVPGGPWSVMVWSTVADAWSAFGVARSREEARSLACSNGAELKYAALAGGEERGGEREEEPGHVPKIHSPSLRGSIASLMNTYISD